MKKKRIIIGNSEVEIPDISPQWIVYGVIAIVVLIIVFSSFYTIDQSAMGVIQRFGKYDRTTTAGLHYKLPFGIETVKEVFTENVFQQEFGFRTTAAGIRTQYDQNARRYEDEYLMLTGDLNSAEVKWVVQYRIQDPVKYLFKVRNPDENLRDITEAIMRLTVGDHSVDEVTNLSRVEVAEAVKVGLQVVLDSYDSGLRIQTVNLTDVFPPDRVKPAFNEVNEAQQEKEKIVNQAWEAYNTIIPKAEGEALKAIENAEGYALQRVNNALGDANRFIAVYREYARAKDVTRRRLYLETMKDVLPQIDQIYVIDSSQKNVVPLLQMLGKGAKNEN